MDSSPRAGSPTGRIRWLDLLLIALAALLAAELFLHRGRTGPRAVAGTRAPAFTLKDTAGGAISLEALRGKVVAVNFWATWCGPCRQEIPDLVRVYAAARGRCFELLGVAEESTREEVMAVASGLGVNYPVLLDEDRSAGDAFDVLAYPRTFLIDAGGRIRAVFEGAVQQAGLEKALAPLLAETAPSCPRA